MKLVSFATNSEGRSLWRCSTCGHQGVWSAGWLWLGNHRDGVDKVFCSGCAPKGVPVLDEKGNGT